MQTLCQHSPKKCNEYQDYFYDRRNWVFQGRGNSGWKGKVDDFVDTVKDQINDFDVFTFKYCYLEGLDEIADPCGKPFNQDKTDEAWVYLKDAYETLENTYPDKIFIWWTIPLTQIGQFCTERMNAKIRDYCSQNSKILFDLADIESYDTLGNHTVNSQGWEIAFKGYCGEKGDNAVACHPNWQGSIMIAKAFWYLMVNVAMLDPNDIIETYSNKFNIFPNPANEFVNIDLDRNQPVLEIFLTGILGNQLLYLQGTDLMTRDVTYKLNLKNIPTGIYYLQIKTGSDLQTKRLIHYE